MAILERKELSLIPFLNVPLDFFFRLKSIARYWSICFFSLS